MGHVNLHKSNVCGGDFCRYIHDICLRHQLNEVGDVVGMNKYGIISQQYRSVEQRELRRQQQGKRNDSKQIAEITTHGNASKS